MSFLLIAKEIYVRDSRCITTSFPNCDSYQLPLLFSPPSMFGQPEELKPV